MDQKLKDISEALIKGQAPLVKELVNDCVAHGLDTEVILMRVLSPE